MEPSVICLAKNTYCLMSGYTLVLCVKNFTDAMSCPNTKSWLIASCEEDQEVPIQHHNIHFGLQNYRNLSHTKKENAILNLMDSAIFD